MKLSEILHLISILNLERQQSIRCVQSPCAHHQPYRNAKKQGSQVWWFTPIILVLRSAKRWRVPGQPRLYRETLSQKQKKKKTKTNREEARDGGSRL
jgi:hypothetical protein